MKSKHFAALLLALLLLLSCAGCGKSEEKPQPTPAVGGTAALTINGTAYSAAQVNYEYMAIYNQYSQYLGAVLPDDAYTMGDEYKTWGECFMAQTKDRLTQLTKLNDLAAKDGVKLDDADKQEIENWIAKLKDSATLTGAKDFASFVEENFGAGVTEEVLRDMATREMTASRYAEYYEEHLSFTQEEIDKAYDADKDSYDVYHFQLYVVPAIDENATEMATDEQMAAAKAKADAILASAQQGTGEAADRLNAAIPGGETAESMQMDGGMIASNGIPFEDWIKDASRAAGDLTVAEEPGYGYFVVLFDGRERNDSPTVNVRHVLIQAEDADGDGQYSDAEMAAAKTAIEQVKAEWDAGEQTEDAFAALANQYSTDPGSNTNGGLYENVYEGQMVPEFNDFCFDDSRKPGDVEIVGDESYHGWHLMYFVGYGEPYTNLLISEELKNDAIEKFVESLTKDAEIVEGEDFGSVGLSDAYLEKLKASYNETYPSGDSTTGDNSQSEQEAQP